MPKDAPRAVHLPEEVWGRDDVLALCRTQDADGLFRLARKYGYTNESIGYWTGIDPVEISKRINGTKGPIRALDRWQRIADGLNMPDRARLAVGLAPTSITSSESITSSAGENSAEIERVRREALAVLEGASSVSASRLDDWDSAITRHGRATRFRGSRPLLKDLVEDFVDLQQPIQRSPSLSTLRRLSRGSAQLAGLISLTLLKVGDPPASRRWSKAAWLIAREVGDPTVTSWVKAQDAYAEFYSGDSTGAVLSAELAQDASGRVASVGFAIAAALEARAQADLGNRQLSLRAIGRAEDALGKLPPSALIDSAFGYNESQLRFHQGDALTRLGETADALAALDTALRHCAPENYLDRALILLARAESLGRSDAAAAVDQALTVVSTLDEPRRDVLILDRARDLVRVVGDPGERRRLTEGLAETRKTLARATPVED